MKSQDERRSGRERREESGRRRQEVEETGMMSVI